MNVHLKGARRIRRRTIRRGQFIADYSSHGQFVAGQFVADNSSRTIRRMDNSSPDNSSQDNSSQLCKSITLSL
jgi:hypothetical protein